MRDREVLDWAGVLGINARGQVTSVSPSLQRYVPCHACAGIVQAAFVVHHRDPGQKYVASGSEDHHIYFWSVQDRQVSRLCSVEVWLGWVLLCCRSIPLGTQTI